MQGQLEQFYFMYKPAAEVIGVFLPSTPPHTARFVFYTGNRA